jgi:glucose/arabinose dehydrogenase
MLAGRSSPLLARIVVRLGGAALAVWPLPAGAQTAPASGTFGGAVVAESRGPQAAVVPGNFVDELCVGGVFQAEGLVFAPDGRLFVWQRKGLVWLVQDGALVQPPVLDISDEVASWGDHGLQGVALDPDFAVNGRIYLNYVVDHYHLTHYGLPGYDPTKSEDEKETIGRITRYELHGDPPVADPASRFVLLGEDIQHGFPVCSASHGLGSLAFGSDGTLLAACGDGQGGPPPSGTALAEGIIQPKENVANYRAQLVDSLAGKIVRIDPGTGDGVSSNPFYDAGAPRAPRSRVWALGLRNPFRFVVRPGTGSSSPASGDPGTLYIGDVGGALQEELSVVTGGGRNLGWPIWEGLQLQPDIGTVPTPNFDAPNPLLGAPLPGGGTCTQAFFNFQDLLLPDALAPPPAMNPCNPAVPVSGATVFVHHRPALAWVHNQLHAYTPVYDAAGDGTIIAVGAPGSPVQGAEFTGNCSVGGTFNTGSSFPAPLAGCYLQADFGLGWIRVFRFDDADEPVEVLPFAESSGPVVALAMGPVDGALYYINYGNSGDSMVRRIRYTTEDKKPHAVLKVSPPYGTAPLTALFDATESSDPEDGPLQYHWDFGDGTPPSTEAQPVHFYPSEDVSAAGTIVARVFELSPPLPNGKGSKNVEVIRDGDFPPLDNTDAMRQFDTCHTAGMVPDKGFYDWIGYTYPEPREFHAVIFQEGIHFSGWGGWWYSFAVQVRQNGVWKKVDPILVQPPYPGLFVPHFETFEMHFLPVVGDGIRLYGIPAGFLQFFSVGELRVLARPPGPLTAMQAFPVQLTVTDAAGNTDTTQVTIGLNDSPPHGKIERPRNYTTYDTAAPQLIKLTSDNSDAESPPSELTCWWQTIEHHNDHTHPGDPVSGCSTSTLLGTEGPDGDVHYVEVVLHVADPSGFASSTSHFLVPDSDRNLNGVPDGQDIASGYSQDNDHDGVPDELLQDCNGNDAADLYDVFFGTSHDANGNGLPDECEPPMPVHKH